MHAIILAAGEGTRLRPLTDDRPKCLVEVAEKPMLAHSLDALAEAGVRRVDLVIGYRGAQLRDAFGDQYRGIALHWIDNPRYATTGNLYSLWLARAAMVCDLYLVESDLLYAPEVLPALDAAPLPDVALVDRFAPPMNGTVILAEDGVSRAMVLKRDQGPDFDYGPALKTVNIYRFSAAYLQAHLVPALDRAVDAGDVRHFYEALIADDVAAGRLRLGALRVPPDAWWAEVDDLEDHAMAEALLRRIHGDAMAPAGT